MLKAKIKAIFCIFSCLLLLLPAIIVTNAKAEAPLSVFVASDLHYRPLSVLGPIGEQTGLPGDPLYWYTNSEGQLTYEADAIMNEMLSRFEASPSKVLLVSGDLTVDGYLPEHLGLAEKLKQFEKRTGKSIFVINGNHDIRGNVAKNIINMAEFKSIYSEFGYSQALDCDESTASYTADIGGGYRVLAIDCVISNQDKGEMNAELMSWSEKQVNSAREDGKKLVAMTHYSMLEHFKNESIAGNSLLVKDYRKVSSQFADWGIKYVFTGHIHGDDISGATSEKGNRIYDVETSSLDAFPNTYRCVTFSPENVKIESKNIDKIDISDLPPGYTAAQLNLIQNDFQLYSYNYFKAGMNSFINKYIGSPNSIANALKIEKGTSAYEILTAVTTDLREALNLPIYDTAQTKAIDSVSEIAELAGFSIEASQYKKLSEIVGSVLASHYSAAENIPYNSPEIRIFKQSFNAAIVYALVNIPVNSAKVLFNEIGLPEAGLNVSKNAYKQTAKLLYTKTAAGKIMNACIQPLIEGFISDSYAPGDLNVTLEAYGVSDASAGNMVPVTNFQQIRNILFRLKNLVNIAASSFN